MTYGRTDRPTDGPTDRRTDTPSYRDARTHLKIVVCVKELVVVLTIAKDVDELHGMIAHGDGLHILGLYVSVYVMNKAELGSLVGVNLEKVFEEVEA